MCSHARKMLWAFPHCYCKVPAKEHIKKIFHFMGYFESISFADNRVPRCSKLLVHGLLDHLSSSLWLKIKLCKVSERVTSMFLTIKEAFLLSCWIYLSSLLKEAHCIYSEKGRKSTEEGYWNHSCKHYIFITCCHSIMNSYLLYSMIDIW